MIHHRPPLKDSHGHLKASHRTHLLLFFLEKIAERISTLRLTSNSGVLWLCLDFVLQIQRGTCAPRVNFIFCWAKCAMPTDSLILIMTRSHNWSSSHCMEPLGPTALHLIRDSLIESSCSVFNPQLIGCRLSRLCLSNTTRRTPVRRSRPVWIQRSAR